MQRDDLVAGVREALTRSGFTVSKPLNMRSISFDIVARRDRSLLLVKVLTNVDAFSKENADDMKTLAEALSGSPLLVGERSGAGEIEEGIVYSRFNVPIISLRTLTELLWENVPPFIFAAPGGLYVKLDQHRHYVVLFADIDEWLLLRDGDGTKWHRPAAFLHGSGQHPRNIVR